ncbi:MAG: DUF1566 domain-containing protein [Candidatus Krumholzibacteriia bacterium]
MISNRACDAPIVILLLAASGVFALAAAGSYPIVDTGQTTCYDHQAAIAAPAEGAPFSGQDAQHDGHQPAYLTSADGLTVADQVTGLVWQRMPDTDLDGSLEPADKLSWWDALEQPAVLNAAGYGGYDDWRLPGIKEIYSLILFSGVDPSGYEGDAAGLVPFLDTDVFGFIYGDENLGERIIDSQYWSATEYVGTTMNGDHTVFGVNFADGRIKGYGTTIMGQDKTAFVLCVRGNPDYGINRFVAGNDGTVTDLATGLMWQQADSQDGMIWQDALAYAENLDLAGHTDWRLPDAKELQSLIDYTRSPATDGTAAIDPLFTCTPITDEGGDPDYGFYWTATTHANWTPTPGAAAAYLCFGSALGWMQAPFPPFEYTLMEVHGAGAQRSDPKTGDPADYPHGHGPQGDVIRIFNLVRCVRDAGLSVGVEDGVPEAPARLLLQAAPNPFNPRTTLALTVPVDGRAQVEVFDVRGRLVVRLRDEMLSAGRHEILWDGCDEMGRSLPSGSYLVQLSQAGQRTVGRLSLVR